MFPCLVSVFEGTCSQDNLHSSLYELNRTFSDRGAFKYSVVFSVELLLEYFRLIPYVDS